MRGEKLRNELVRSGRIITRCERCPLRSFTEKEREAYFLCREDSFLIFHPNWMRGAELCRRLAAQFFENTIELRQRLKADGKRDFADAQIWIL